MRALLAFISLVTFIPELYSISLEQYIAENGMPQIEASTVGRTLDLSNKNLTDITNLQVLIPDVKQVHSLYLGNNQLKVLPATVFSNLNNLKSLRLENNQLQMLPANIFNGLSNLNTLVLSNNKLEKLPENIFNGLNNLERLFIDGNQFNTLPKTIFSGLNRLNTLNLKGNPFELNFIDDLREMIHNIPTLVWLNKIQKDQALKKRPFYFPTLQTITEERIAKNIENYRHRLHELTVDIIDQLPLSEQERSQLIIEKVKQNIDEYSIDTLNQLPLSQQERVKLIVEKLSKNINAYRDELPRLTEDVLNQLPLTPQQRAAIAAKKRQMEPVSNNNT